MKKKMKFYLPLLFILWSGAFIQGAAKEAKEYTDRNIIEAIQESSGILFEKEYDGKMSQTEMEQKAQFLLASYQGEMVKEVIGENFYSFYGFSDKVETYVASDGERINLNLVITYDEERDITRIVFATPFLNEDF